MDEKAIPRQGMPIAGGGEVTSGTHSPSLDVGIGMGYVPTDHAAVGAALEIDVRGRAKARHCGRETDLPEGAIVASESYPDDLRYHPEHDWARVEGDEAVLGITWYAQDALGELVHFEAPEAGATLTKDQAYAEVESVKAVSDVIAPLSGEVLEVNQKAVDGARDDQRGPVRRGVARPDPALGPGRGRPPAGRRGLQGARGRAVGVSTAGYLSLTDADREAMLEAIGVASLDELFAQIPEGVRFGRELDVPGALPEAALVRHLEELAARNTDTTRELSFLGMGIYDHYVPAIVDAFLSRGELLTAYTPYQPEMSQGILQAIFEYQTVICELTAMDVSNASGYDGTTVAADACFVARMHTGRSKVVLAETLNPQVRQVVKTYAPGFGMEVVEVPHTGGTTDPALLAAASQDAAAVIFQQPNAFGCLEPAPELAAAAGEGGALPGRTRRPRVAGAPRGARELRVRDGDRRGPVDRQLPVLRRPALRLPRRAKRVHPPHARADRR